MNFKKNIKLDYLHTFFRNLNFTQAIWLLYLASRGFSLFEIGIFEMIFHITSLSMEVPTGMIADLFGRKFSRILGVLSYIVYIFIMIYSQNIILVGIGFVFCGLSYTLESGSGEALVYDSLQLMNQEDKFMKVNGRKEVIYQLVSSLSFFVGGYIAMVSYDLSFLTTLVAMLIALTIIVLMKETPIIKSEMKKSFKILMSEQYKKTYQTAVENKRIMFLIIIGSMVAAPVTSIFFYFQNHLDLLGYDKGEIGLLLGAHALFAAIGGASAYKLEKKYNEKKILYFIPLLMVVLFWLVLIDSIVFIPFVLLGFFDSIFYVVLNDYVNKIIPSELRASILSVFGLVFSVIMIFIFPLIGFIGEYVNLKTSFLILAIIVSVFYIILLFILRGDYVLTKTKKEVI